MEEFVSSDQCSSSSTHPLRPLSVVTAAGGARGASSWNMTFQIPKCAANASGLPEVDAKGVALDRGSDYNPQKFLYEA